MNYMPRLGRRYDEFQCYNCEAVYRDDECYWLWLDGEPWCDNCGAEMIGEALDWICGALASDRGSVTKDS